MITHRANNFSTIFYPEFWSRTTNSYYDFEYNNDLSERILYYEVVLLGVSLLHYAHTARNIQKMCLQKVRFYHLSNEREKTVFNSKYARAYVQRTIYYVEQHVLGCRFI